MKFFAFGLGYCARYFLEHSASAFDACAGTVRGPAKAGASNSRSMVNSAGWGAGATAPAYCKRVSR